MRAGRLFTLLGLVTLTALIVWLAILLTRRLPHRTVVMAVYPEGSLSAELAKRYQDVLRRDGVDLKLVQSAGAVDTLSRLRDPKSPISVALIPAGLTDEQESPNLVSLGTLFYQPLWVFFRGHQQLSHRHSRGLRISIGPEGSSSHALSLMLLGRAGIIDQKSVTLLAFTPSESVDKLIHGDIDAAVFLEGWDSPAVQQLLNTKDVKLESISRADAFVALYPYLTKLVLPAGVVDMKKPLPLRDVQLIAAKSSLVVREGLDPAIQYLLLQAAAEIHSPAGVFHAAGQFPSPESIGLPLSSYARDFYKTGLPFLHRHLPFWLAALIEQPILWLIPLIVVLFPVFRLAPVIYDWAEKRRIYKLYAELMRLEEDLLFAAPGRTHADSVEELDRLEDRASRLSVPTPFKPLVYALRLHIDLVREEARKSVVASSDSLRSGR